MQCVFTSSAQALGVYGLEHDVLAGFGQVLDVRLNSVLRYGWVHTLVGSRNMSRFARRPFCCCVPIQLHLLRLARANMPSAKAFEGG